MLSIFQPFIHFNQNMSAYNQSHQSTSTTESTHASTSMSAILLRTMSGYRSASLGVLGNPREIYWPFQGDIICTLVRRGESCQGEKYPSDWSTCGLGRLLSPLSFLPWIVKCVLLRPEYWDNAYRVGWVHPRTVEIIAMAQRYKLLHMDWQDIHRLTEGLT